MSSRSPSDPASSLVGPAPAAITLASALLLVHLLTGWWAWSSGEADILTAWLGERPSSLRVLVGGRYQPLLAEEPWRLASSVLLHVDGLHLVVNALALVLVGRWMESTVGATRMLALFVVGGVVGGLGSHLVGIPQSDGASAGLSAWLGAGWLWGWRDEDVPAERAATWVRVLGPVALMNILVALLFPGIDAMAHTCGTAVGLLWAGMDRRRGPARGAGVLVVLFVLAALAGLTGVLGSHWTPVPR